MTKLKTFSDSEKLFSNSRLWALIWPLLIENFLQISLGLADTLMVASLGEEAVSGVSLVDQINILVMQIFAALGTGGAVVCSQYIGRQDKRNSSETARQVLIAVTISSTVLMLAGLLCYKQLLAVTFHGIKPDVSDAANRYFFISLFAIPGLALYNAAAALFRANGNSAISMKIAVLVNVLNIGGNALMIYGFHWYVEGVAFPTFVSRTAAAIVLLYFLYKTKRNTVKTASETDNEYISIKGIFHTLPKAAFISRIMKIGIPNMLEGSSFQFGKILVLNIVAAFGTGAIAANAAGNTLASIEVIAGNAVGLAMLTVIGQCIGAGKKDQAIYYTKKLTAWAYLSFFAVNLPLLIFSKKILMLFNLSIDTTNAAWAITLCHGILGILFWCLSFCLPNALRAAGDTTFTMIVSTASMWIVRVGLAIVFQKTRLCGLMDYFNLPECFGALCVWFAMVIDWIVRLSFFVWRFYSGKWLTKKVI